jgi:hypothetical protein
VNHLRKGFALELLKVGGPLKSIGKTVLKHPLTAALAIGTAATTGMAAAGAYKEGLRGGEKPRYLYAGVDPSSGQIVPSEAAYTNYHETIGDRKPTPKQVAALSKHYNEKKFKR